MNISSNYCWSNIWDSYTLTNVGPDVLSLRQGNLIKFIKMSTMTVSYFKAETVATGLYIDAFAGHNRFSLFAFSDSVLRPNINVYRYPEFTRFSTIPPDMLKYVELCFSEYDLIIGIGSQPTYPLAVFNFRTGNKILQYSTNVPAIGRHLYLSNSSLPTIVQLHKNEMSLICYDMCFVEKDSSLHKVSQISLGKHYFKSMFQCTCFGDDNALYVVNDFGQFSQIEIACFFIKSCWSPNALAIMGAEPEPLGHKLTAHKNGFLIANSNMAYYIKKKGGHFSLEWSIDDMISNINIFISNGNGELYAERLPGSIHQVVLEENESTLLEVVATGAPIKYFRILHGLKDESMLLLYEDRIAMVDLLRGQTQSELFIEKGTFIATHKTLPFAVVGTADARLVLVHVEKATAMQIVCELQLEAAAIALIQYHDNSIVCQDLTKALLVVNVDYKPYRMTHFFSINEDVLIKDAFVHSHRLVEGPRLLMFVTRDKDVKLPGYATELWIYQWSKDKRLHKHKFKLPKAYVYVTVQPPTGRWVTVEFYAVVKDSNCFDMFVLSNRNDIHWHSSVKTTHFAHISGMYVTKQLISWGVDGVMVHLRQHKRSKKPFMISRYVKLLFTPKFIVRARDCFNSKYLIVLYSGQVLRVHRLPSLSDNVRENTELFVEEGFFLNKTKVITTPIITISALQEMKETQYTAADFLRRDKVFDMIKEFAEKVTALIDYDMSVTGKTQGIFKKFCFNYNWLDAVTEEAQKLCAAERASLEQAIEDQSRIRDWILKLVTKEAININYKVRSIFADANFENFALWRKPNLNDFDKFRFYDLEDHMRVSLVSMDDEEELSPPKSQSKTGRLTTDIDEMGEEEHESKVTGLTELKPYVVENKSIYDHVMAPVFQLQNKNIVTSYQIFNICQKYGFYIFEPIKQEFNKLFHEAQQMKQETIESVLGTNDVLYKIYNNMNIMLGLLYMDMFKPPKLSIPELAKDEVIKCIMEVDDSEINAINRRRKKTIDLGGKRGRLLLWSVEFWSRALIVMMDGVLEKLWEEEIKKDIPIPEFVNKKQPHEYSLEEQKMFRAYEEAVVQLGKDRLKYLGILREREAKTLKLKTQQIQKLNKRVAELMMLKLKYDFAIKQDRIRVMNLKGINFGRVQLRKRINMFRNDEQKLHEYIVIYGKLAEFWEKALADVRTRLETQQNRDRALDRHFRNIFLNTVPHAQHEMTKLFKKRPKLTTKLFGSPLVCMETSTKLMGKQTQRAAFPLSKEIHDFLALLEENDQPKQCPQQVSHANWEAFTKLRRQKIESELKLKGIGFQLNDCQAYCNNLNRDMKALEDAKLLTHHKMKESTEKYLELMRNMPLQLTLSLGQVEVAIRGNMRSLSGCVLMHENDINEVNRLINEAGNQKLKSMQRVATFRRQVIYKEWEHKLYKSNIAYLKYMLDAIEKCKVTVEFLNILRNWEKVKQERQKYMAAGAIERVLEQKIAGFRKHIDRVNLKIDYVKQKTLQIKRDSHATDSIIERVKVDVAYQNTMRDYMMEERRDREQAERMNQIKTHRGLLDKVRRNYAHVLELQTILELLRLRTYPTLGPPPPHCHPPVPEQLRTSKI